MVEKEKINPTRGDKKTGLSVKVVFMCRLNMNHHSRETKVWTLYAGGLSIQVATITYLARYVI